MSEGSIERVEKWGNALAELSEILRKQEIKVAEEELLEVPKCFEDLEQLVGSIMVEDIQAKIATVIRNSLSPTHLAHEFNVFNYAWCMKPWQVNFEKSFGRAFDLDRSDKSKLSAKGSLTIYEYQKINLPNLRRLLSDLHTMKLEPTLAIELKRPLNPMFSLACRYNARFKSMLL